MQPHVLLGQLDEVRADPVAHAARAAVEHEPDAVRLVQAHLDEVVPGAERAEWFTWFELLIRPCLAVIASNRGLRSLPRGDGRRWRVLPRALVAAPRRPPVRHRSLDRRAHRAQALGQVAGGQRGSTAIMPQPMSTPTAAGMIAPTVGMTLPTVAPIPQWTSGIAATQPWTNGSRATFRELLGRGLLEAHAADPCLDRHPAGDLDDLVWPLGAHEAALSSPVTSGCRVRAVAGFGRDPAHERFTRWYTICSLPSGSANTTNE